MFKNQPKGLYALALANTGERFGYYTMLAIFTLFLQAKFGFSSTATSNIFAGFLALVYFLPILGGILADKFGYGKMVTAGIVVMFAGYTCLAIPTGGDAFGIAAMFGALFLIALGTGLFKGNLQVMVGNLYDDPKYSDKRDTAFSLFYMAINIGALFAPTAASKITEHFMGKAGFKYQGDIPALCHEFLDKGQEMATESLNTLTQFAHQVSGFNGDLAAFSHKYIDELSLSYHYGFAVACISLIASMLIYQVFKRTFKHADVNTKQAAANGKQENIVELTPEQTKSRITALVLVFAVVIFFWMAFHQNGLTLTFFARDYTARTADGALGMSFNVFNLVFVITLIYSLFSLFQSKEMKSKLISAAVACLSIGILVYKYMGLQPGSFIEVLPQMFQQFNPFFVVALTPVSLAVFGALAKRGNEPSAPRKIGIGMLIAALGFAVMAFFSMGLPTPNPDGATVIANDLLVSPSVLINTYLVLTFAELFLSPMGISFVSKVAPPKYKGLMMGLWFGATAVGNYLVSIIGMLWGHMELWALWSILITLCLLSALFIFMMMKRLENATK
ncbi:MULTISPECIES: peptide MFS transporter [Culturomica]|jgi:POT family proton-dependent oligopeptide transporter|uniref:peptide MFS transporter n=1 Tax=Culturomica TaxID=1926651 RepID=UPI00033FE20E|nr:MULTISPECIES: peptide MFS transporter [Culturomica]CCZ10840.1 amino acid/peptide transporter [Odoribacter sp. CAG:788]HBO26531.1 MFS transporter [Culturomica sp.]